MNALFLHDPHDLTAAVPGGVQLCTKEFLEIVESAVGAKGRVVRYAVRPSRSPTDRMIRFLGLRSYAIYAPEHHAGALLNAINAHGITHVFINRCELLRFAATIKRVASHVTVILMSHGNQSGDDLYELAGPHGRRRHGLARFRGARRLGRDLVLESTFRHRSIDLVAVMSNEEATLERWLGASHVVVLPRLIHATPLARRPIAGRIGYVGTLNHTPNRAALIDVALALRQTAASGTQIRVVGGPADAGHSLTQAHPNLHYVGRLSDEELAREAETWSLFLNPIFWLSRGASMKLGQALAWRIPTISTRSGARGYEWSAGGIALTPDNAQAFAAEAGRLLDDHEALTALEVDTTRAAESSPSVAVLARRLNEALLAASAA